MSYDPYISSAPSFGTQRSGAKQTATDYYNRVIKEGIFIVNIIKQTRASVFYFQSSVFSTADESEWRTDLWHIGSYKRFRIINTCWDINPMHPTNHICNLCWQASRNRRQEPYDSWSENHFWSSDNTFLK